MFGNITKNDRRAVCESINARDLLPLSADPLLRICRETFGLDYIYPVQRFVMANILDGVHQIVILPTGSGKSLCFQLPACYLHGLTIVIVPLLALLKDQLRRLQELSIPAACLHGEQSNKEKEQLFKDMAAGHYRLIYTTPESLQSARLRKCLQKANIVQLVIDEAHCVTEWGETFRPAYLDLHTFINYLPVKPVITAFTATASDRIINKIRQELFPDLSVSLVKGYADRTNLFYRVLPVLSKEKTLYDLLVNSSTPVLIFTRSRKRAESWARILNSRLAGRDVYFYHAGLDKVEREKVENWFFASKNGVLFSTSAYGMGVDKPDIRTVIHVDIPPSLEAYLQESGRAGRDHQPAQIYLLYSAEDEQYLHKLDTGINKERYTMMLNYARNNSTCRREYLLSLLGQHLEICTGCDICRHEIPSPIADFKALLRFFNSNRRRYTKREVLHILYGRYHYEVLQQELYQDKYFGLLKHWERDEIAEALHELLARGIIRLPVKGFWKNRVTQGKAVWHPYSC